MCKSVVEIKNVGADSWGRELFVTQRGVYLCKENNKLFVKNPVDDADGEPDYAIKTDNIQVVEQFSR